MITIEIKTKGKRKAEKISIKTFKELSVKELIKWLDLQREGVETNIIHYLSIVLGIEYKAAYNLNIKNPDVLIESLGDVVNYETEKPAKKIIIGDCIYDFDDISIFSVGQRHTIEENINQYKNEEMLCYFLACAILGTDSTDAYKVKSLKDKILNCNYADVLPAAFFLLKIFLNGNKQETNYLRLLMEWISTKLKRNRQE